MKRRDFLRLGGLLPAVAAAKLVPELPGIPEAANATIRATWEAQREPWFKRNFQAKLKEHKARVLGKREDKDCASTVWYLEVPGQRRIEGCPAHCIASIFVFRPEG